MAERSEGAEGAEGAEESLIESFWVRARRHARLDPVPGYFGPSPLASVPPPAWSFGATPEQADRLLALVRAGTKTATASALWDYEAQDEPLPEPGTLGIVLDGHGRPGALIATTGVRVVPFDEVDAEHAYAEGEGDRSLSRWREVHRRFFAEHFTSGRGIAEDMPVVLERFEVLHLA